MANPRLLIKEVAKAKGFDAAKLARRADMSYSTVWSLWNNPYRLNIPVKTLARIAEVLNVPIGQLIVEETKPPEEETTTH
jgi:transcriptional regulator with XRE-family HTH domain